MFFCVTAGGKERKRLPISYYLSGGSKNDIAKRKKLRYREDILDNMGSEELAANLFRITQTEAKLKKDNIEVLCPKIYRHQIKV